MIKELKRLETIALCGLTIGLSCLLPACTESGPVMVAGTITIAADVYEFEGKNFYCAAFPEGDTTAAPEEALARNVMELASGFLEFLLLDTETRTSPVSFPGGESLEVRGFIDVDSDDLRTGGDYATVTANIVVDGDKRLTLNYPDAFEMVPYTPLTTVVAAAAGYQFSLFMRSDRTLWAAGDNMFGQLGDGSTTRCPTPVQVATDVSTVVAGNSHTLFIKSDGTLWGMGGNSQGQLGDGTTTDRHSPVQVRTDVTAVAAGSYHSFFITSDGTLWGMGSNTSYKLGDGTFTDRHSPVYNEPGNSDRPRT